MLFMQCPVKGCIKNIGSNTSAHVPLNLSSQLGKEIKCEIEGALYPTIASHIPKYCCMNIKFNLFII